MPTVFEVYIFLAAILILKKDSSYQHIFRRNINQSSSTYLVIALQGAAVIIFESLTDPSFNY